MEMLTPCILWDGAKDQDGYGMRSVGRSSRRVHILTWEESNGPVPEGMIVEHRCRNRACFNLEHLRPATRSQNNANSGKQSRDTTSQFKGVSRRRDRSRWQAEICFEGKRHRLGHFVREEDAALAYNRAAVELFGEFAFLNDVDDGVPADPDRALGCDHGSHSPTWDNRLDAAAKASSVVVAARLFQQSNARSGSGAPSLDLVPSLPTNRSRRRAVCASAFDVSTRYRVGTAGIKGRDTSRALMAASSIQRNGVNSQQRSIHARTEKSGVGGGIAAPGVNRIVRHVSTIPPRGRKVQATMGMKGQGAPLPLSADLQGEIIEIGARWRLALVDGVISDAEAQALKADWDRFSRRAGLLAATVDLIRTAVAGAEGMHSKRFLDKIMPLKRKRYLTVVAANDYDQAA